MNLKLPGRRRAALSVFVAAVAIGAAFPAEKDLKIEPAVQRALDAAEALPVELTADLVSAIVRSGRLPKDAELAHLDKLYWRAGEATLPLPMSPTPRYEASTAASGYAAGLSHAGLTALGIRLRVIERLVQLDRSSLKALRNSAIGQSPSTESPCDATEIQTVGKGYYATLFKAFPDDFDLAISRLSTAQEAAAFLSFLSSAGTAGELGGPRISHAMSAVLRVLDSDKVSAPVFVATEASLKLGENLENLLNGQLIPPGLQIPLARAWNSYLERHLRDTKCGDQSDTADVGTIRKEGLARAERLAAKFGFGQIDASTIPPRPQRQRGGARDPVDSELGELMTLGNKLLNGGDESVASRFAAEVQLYVTKGLDGSANVFDTFRRAVVLIMIMNGFKDPEIAKVCIEELYRVLESPKAMENPTASILMIRSALNLTMHPEPKIAEFATARFDRSVDPRVHAYVVMDRLVGLVGKYNPDGIVDLSDISNPK